MVVYRRLVLSSLNIEKSVLRDMTFTKYLHLKCIIFIIKIKEVFKKRNAHTELRKKLLNKTIFLSYKNKYCNIDVHYKNMSLFPKVVISIKSTNLYKI